MRVVALSRLLSRAFPFLLGLLVAGGTTGCTTYRGELPVVALRGSAADLETFTDSRLPVKRDQVGSDWAITSVLFVPTGARPRLSDALEGSMRRAGGGSVVAARIRTSNWWLGVSVARLRVEADVAQIVRVGADEGEGGSFALISNERIRADDGSDDVVRRVEDVEGTETVRRFLWVPSRPEPPRLEAAIEQAIARGGGDVLVDADVEYTWWTVPFLYGVERWHARGDSVRLPRPAR